MIKGFCFLPIDKLYIAKWNYKVWDADLQEKLINNIKRNGQVENIIVRSVGKDKFEVINGNHRLVALKELDVQDIFCYNVGKITKAKAMRIAVETNETRFNSDPIKLHSTVKDILSEFDIEDVEKTLPFDNTMLQSMGDSFDFNWGTDKLRSDDEVVTGVVQTLNKLGIELVPVKDGSVLEKELERVKDKYRVSGIAVWSAIIKQFKKVRGSYAKKSKVKKEKGS